MKAMIRISLWLSVNLAEKVCKKIIEFDHPDFIMKHCLRKSNLNLRFFYIFTLSIFFLLD